MPATVIEHLSHVLAISVGADALLAGHEGKALAEFQQEDL